MLAITIRSVTGSFYGPSLLPVATAFQDSRYLLFGFGDRGYVLHGGAGNAVGRSGEVRGWFW